MRNRLTFVPRDGLLLAGWVFADLLLGMMVIFMVSIRGEPVPATTLPSSEPTAAIPPSSTATLAPTITPFQTATAQAETATPAFTATPQPTQAPAVSTLPVKFTVRVSNAQAFIDGDQRLRQSVIDQIQTALKQRNISISNGTRIGIVLTFGVSPSTQNFDEGNKISRIINDELLCVVDPIMFPTSDGLCPSQSKERKYPAESFHNVNRDPAMRGSAEIWLYLFVRD